MTDPAQQQALWKRLGWFILLWAGGLLAVTILAWVVRLVMPLGSE